MVDKDDVIDVDVTIDDIDASGTEVMLQFIQKLI